jgi:hypothetical protein
VDTAITEIKLKRRRKEKKNANTQIIQNTSSPIRANSKI